MHTIDATVVRDGVAAQKEAWLRIATGSRDQTVRVWAAGATNQSELPPVLLQPASPPFLLSSDGAALAAHLDAELPAYAAPLFVRLLGEVETTGTFKYKKADLKQAGYDPAKVDGPLYVRLPGSKSFEPLSHEIHADIKQQRYRF